MERWREVEYGHVILGEASVHVGDCVPLDLVAHFFVGA